MPIYPTEEKLTIEQSNASLKKGMLKVIAKNAADFILGKFLQPLGPGIPENILRSIEIKAGRPKMDEPI